MNEDPKQDPKEIIQNCILNYFSSSGSEKWKMVNSTVEQMQKFDSNFTHALIIENMKQNLDVLINWLVQQDFEKQKKIEKTEIRKNRPENLHNEIGNREIVNDIEENEQSEQSRCGLTDIQRLCIQFRNAENRKQQILSSIKNNKTTREKIIQTIKENQSKYQKCEETKVVTCTKITELKQELDENMQLYEKNNQFLLELQKQNNSLKTFEDQVQNKIKDLNQIKQQNSRYSEIITSNLNKLANDFQQLVANQKDLENTKAQILRQLNQTKPLPDLNQVRSQIDLIDQYNKQAEINKQNFNSQYKDQELQLERLKQNIISCNLVLQKQNEHIGQINIQKQNILTQCNQLIEKDQKRKQQYSYLEEQIRKYSEAQKQNENQQQFLIRQNIEFQKQYQIIDSVIQLAENQLQEICKEQQNIFSSMRTKMETILLLHKARLEYKALSCAESARQ